MLFEIVRCCLRLFEGSLRLFEGSLRLFEIVRCSLKVEDALNAKHLNHKHLNQSTINVLPTQFW
jgi:hypothetical protein